MGPHFLPRVKRAPANLHLPQKSELLYVLLLNFLHNFHTPPFQDLQVRDASNEDCDCEEDKKSEHLK